ncbi:sulfatase [Roseateles sp. BYS180W]|uniref:Sulfatase n=1 Tax=Roseateles rivi TaxID=3299028 RepID=A0ABW7FU85_9BURK
MPNQHPNRRRQLLQGLAGLSLGSALRPSAASSPPKRPNILFILADDMGYADLGVYGQRDFATPHLDRLAQQGLRFTQGYANSAVCSATRFGLITGRYQYRLRGGLEEPIAGASDTLGLPAEHPTLPSLLKRLGYRTALVGKWHLGSLPKFGPLKSGYDEFFGNVGGAVDYFTHKSGVGADLPSDLYEGEVRVEKVGYYTDLLAERAQDFIRRQSDAQPFLLSLHFTAPHWPWEGPGDEAVSRQLRSLSHLDGGSLKKYGEIVGALDAAVGRVLATLDAQGLADNTIVVFTSDNGGERFSNTWPFSGQKTELLEGGIRVPTLLRWPARVAAGGVSEQVSISMDWLPTLLAAAGGAPDPAYPSDGRNLLPQVLGQQGVVERTLFWRYKANAQRAARQGPWKYLKIRDNEFLFRLDQDARERANLAKREPQRLAALRQAWEDWDQQMLPIPAEARTHQLTGKTQADRYGAAPQR